jgi:hypothetical protein
MMRKNQAIGTVEVVQARGRWMRDWQRWAVSLACKSQGLGWFAKKSQMIWDVGTPSFS